MSYIHRFISMRVWIEKLGFHFKLACEKH